MHREFIEKLQIIVRQRRRRGGGASKSGTGWRAGWLSWSRRPELLILLSFIIYHHPTLTSIFWNGPFSSPSHS